MGSGNSLCSKRQKLNSFDDIQLPKITEEDFPMLFRVNVKHFWGIELKSINVCLSLDFFGKEQI